MEVDSLVTMNTYKATATYPKHTETTHTEQTSSAETGSSQNIIKNAVPKTGTKNKSNNPQNTKSEAVNETVIDTSALDKAIEKANKQLYSVGREFSYSVHEKTRQVMIKVMDSESKEIIREIPPEKTLDAIAKMWELAGILVDEKR